MIFLLEEIIANFIKQTTVLKPNYDTSSTLRPTVTRDYHDIRDHDIWHWDLSDEESTRKDNGCAFLEKARIPIKRWMMGKTRGDRMRNDKIPEMVRCGGAFDEVSGEILVSSCDKESHVQGERHTCKWVGGPEEGRRNNRGTALTRIRGRQNCNN